MKEKSYKLLMKNVKTKKTLVLQIVGKLSKCLKFKQEIPSQEQFNCLHPN